MAPGVRALVIAALWLTAVVPAASAAPPQSDPAAIDRFVRYGLPFLPGTSTVAISAIRSLGALEGESVQKVANPLDPLKVDEYRHFAFNGLGIDGYVGERGELWPVRVVVTGAQWKILHDLGVGVPAGRVIDVLGAAAETTADVLAYHGDTQSVNFHLHAGLVVKVEFIYYQDRAARRGIQRCWGTAYG